MHHFHYIGGRLHCEDVLVEDVAESMGTPFYLYSHATLVQHFNAFDDSFRDVPHLTCFSVKSNSNLGILRLFAGKGGGADIVSGGELYRCLAAGVQPGKIVYSGVGKKYEEMAYALDSGILMFNIESGQELKTLSRVAAEKGITARVAFRVNPDVDHAPTRIFRRVSKKTSSVLIYMKLRGGIKPLPISRTLKWRGCPATSGPSLPKFPRSSRHCGN
jgi:diaminopimelate decarboxylase